MNRNEALETLTSTSSTRAALCVALKALDSYSGKTEDGTNVCRASLPALRAYCAQVASRLAPPAPVVVVEEPVAQPSEPTERKASARQDRNDATLLALVAGGTVQEDGTVVVGFEAYSATCGAINTNCAFSISGWRTGSPEQMPSRSNPYFAAALRLGLRVVWSGERRGTGTLLVTRLTEQQAQEQRDAFAAGCKAYEAALATRRAARPAVAPTVDAARKAPVSAKTVKAFAKAIAAAKADEQGCVTLDGEALALAGVGASWASTTNAHLADEQHVAARTLATLGYTGRTSRGVLALTPCAAAKTEQAAG